MELNYVNVNCFSTQTATINKNIINNKGSVDRRLRRGPVYYRRSRRARESVESSLRYLLEERQEALKKFVKIINVSLSGHRISDRAFMSFKTINLRDANYSKGWHEEMDKLMRAISENSNGRI